MAILRIGLIKGLQCKQNQELYKAFFKHSGERTKLKNKKVATATHNDKVFIKPPQNKYSNILA